ncbi:MAG TPA: ATP-binding protein, partial [Candidatus Eisenbacteria bacterium]|nr:ATP-binding protein [Candidatus Eisenbacteria bacterium]
AAKAEIAQLTHELAATKEYLQSLLEQQDAANEELRSANEEILSSNEELQSTNEELQIAHEELQAANEELVTVNEQLRYRNAELNRISNDLSNLLASTGIAVLMLDRNLCIRRFTDTAKALLNLNAGDVWRAFDGLGPLEGATDFHDRLLEAIENAQTHERVVQDRAGRWYMLRIRPYRADHTIDGAVLVMIDISERKKLEEELETLIRDLSEADRHKNEFLATLAHELRNPLAPIRNAVGVLRSKHATQSDIEWCRDLIDRQVGQMARLMDDLFDVARIARDRLELRRERMVLADALEKALEISRPYLESQGHDLVRELAPEAIWIEADPARISQVFSNLLNNAAKYTPPGGKIIVSGERREREAVVSVKDTGIGIPEELLPRVFDMFKQGKLEPGRSPGGLGLGLTLAKKLVELHGGRIEARSEGPGRGSEFIVRLPVAEPADSVKAAESQEPAPVTSQTDMPKRVLVVDDSEVQTHSLRMFLELNGYEVRTARDAPSALDLMGRFVPDVAVVDIGLPGMSGYALAQRIRERPEWHQLVLIAQTGWGRDEDRRNALRAGFDHHLTKPFEPEAMLRLMAEALKRPADENRRAS